MKSYLFLSILFVALLAVVAVSGCYYDKEASLYPSVPCVSSDITYTTGVKPILDQHCNTCHNTSANQGNVILDTYAGLKITVTNGKLIGCILHNSGFSPMPKNAGSLSACQLTIIQDWVNAGAQNN